MKKRTSNEFTENSITLPLASLTLEDKRESQGEIPGEHDTIIAGRRTCSRATCPICCAWVAEVDLVIHSDCSVHPPDVFPDPNLGRLVRSFLFD
jgi:hypothetical protein